MESGGSLQNDDLKWECKRLQTFRDYGWPSSAAISCEKLAKAGFHYAGAHDEVICCWCNLRHAFWKFTDQAIAVHAQNSPNCAFIRNPAESGNVPSANYSSVPIQNVTSSGQNVPESDVQPRSRSGSASSGYFNITRSGSSTSVAAEAAAKFRAEKVIRISEAPNLMCETDRFRTFRNWPNMHVNPAELARWGFYYTGTADTVECIFCRGRLNNWLAHEFPYVEHRKHFPQCRFIQGLEVGNISDDSGASSSSEGNRNLTSVSINLLPLPLVTPSVGGSIPVPLVTPSVGGSAVTSITFHNNNVENENHAANDATSDDYKKHLKELGVFTDTPACPEMATQAARLSTFNGWPPDSIQHPQQLVDAGFYYSGTGDAVKCFQCSGGLRNWLPGDDVWVEHARWFPRCEYVRMNKGDAFVRTVLEKFSKSNGEKAIKSVDKMQGQIVVRVEEDKELASGVDTGVDMRSLGAVTLETLKLHGVDLSDDQIQSAIEMGYDSNLIANAIAVNNFKLFDSISALVDFLERIQSESAFAASGASGANDGESKEMRRNRLNSSNEQRICKICMDNEICMVFLPCGHLVSCPLCAPALRNCPICRTEVRGTVRSYLA